MLTAAAVVTALALAVGGEAVEDGPRGNAEAEDAEAEAGRYVLHGVPGMDAWSDGAGQPRRSGHMSLQADSTPDRDHPPNALPSAMSGDQPTISKIANVARKSDACATETSSS